MFLVLKIVVSWIWTTLRPYMDFKSKNIRDAPDRYRYPVLILSDIIQIPYRITGRTSDGTDSKLLCWRKYFFSILNTCKQLHMWGFLSSKRKFPASSNCILYRLLAISNNGNYKRLDYPVLNLVHPYKTLSIFMLLVRTINFY